MDISKIVRDVLLRAYSIAKESNSEYVTPEHLLLSALEENSFKNVILRLNADIDELKGDLNKYIDEYIDKQEDGEPEESYGIKNILIVSTQQAAFSERNFVALEHIISALYALKDSHAVYYFEKQGIDKQQLLFELSHNKAEEENLAKDAIKIIKVNKEDSSKKKV